MLTSAQRDQFWEDGFLAEAGHIETGQLSDLQHSLAQMLEAARNITQSDDRYDLAPDHAPERIRCRRIKEPYRFSQAFADLLHSSHLLDIVESLLGPDIYFEDMPLNIKPPSRAGNEIGWHQDWVFQPLTNDNALTATIALCDCTLANGALQVVPGTHRTDPIYSHNHGGKFTGAVDPGDIEVEWHRKIVVEVPAGTITLHHARTLHGSGTNLTELDRPLQAIGLCAGDAWPRKISPDKQMADVQAKWLRGNIRQARWDDTVPLHVDRPRANGTTSLFDMQQASDFDLFKR